MIGFILLTFKAAQCSFFIYDCPHTACGLLVPQAGTEAVPSAAEAWSLNHCTTSPNDWF